jgi:protein-S-isoprenylcysteine O-methyltransferase Ste14
MVMTEHSPWWYRLRGLVLGLIFVAAFFGGSALWSIGGRTYWPVTAWAGLPMGEQGPELLLAIATLLVIAGWAVRVWGSSYLSARVVWNPDARTDALLVDGPFRYVRNPLYLGNALFATGIGMLATPYGFAIIVIGHSVFLPMLMHYEARGLRARYGSVYDTFAREVPAFVPRLTPATVSGSVSGVPSLAQGLRAEILSACLVMGMVAVWFAGDRSEPIFFALWIGGWIVQRLAAPPLRESA